jgi:hypothetical protein
LLASQGWLSEYHIPFNCLPVDLCLPSRLGAGIWQHSSPPSFSIYCGMGKLCEVWGFKGVRVLPLLGDFSCQVCLQHLSKIFTLWSSCSLLPPSSHHLGTLKSLTLDGIMMSCFSSTSALLFVHMGQSVGWKL